MAPDALIVDLDGTVWDSFPFYAGLLARASNGSSSEILTRLKDGANVVSLIGKSEGLSRSGFERLCRDEGSDIDVYPTVLETLSAAFDAGVRLGVATSLPGWICTPLLEATGLERLFEAVTHAGNCRARKPSALVLSNVMDAIGAEPAGSVFVGDSRKDALTARAAGARFLWVAYGYEPPDPALASAVITEFSQVLEA